MNYRNYSMHISSIPFLIVNGFPLWQLSPKREENGEYAWIFSEINKETLRDDFPLPFIDKVLDTLLGKQYFSFLDGYSGYNQIRIAFKDQEKTTFTYPWGTYAYKVLPFGLCNAPATFQMEVLGIMADLIHDCIEIYIDEFRVYGNNFEESLHNLKKKS